MIKKAKIDKMANEIFEGTADPHVLSILRDQKYKIFTLVIFSRTLIRVKFTIEMKLKFSAFSDDLAKIFSK